MVRNKIALLEKETIDQIAAGEVVERPASVVKELVENAIDAGADAITVEIKDGGKSYIRITDNGCGIPEEELSVAFLRHSTSKLREATELKDIHTLGFRGEALSSISAVSRVEMITKTADELMGVHYVIEGSKEISLDRIGAPDGTTIMVYQLFYNTPARKKFLKTDQTEASYISELMERLALSHPDISFSYIANKREKMHTSGNGNLMDAIYQIYGRQIASNLLMVEKENERLWVCGFIGNPTVARGNRNLENFYINGRYIKSPILSKAVETGYQGYLMQHQYPFCVLLIRTKNTAVDVNVHPTKQEVRFEDEIHVAEFFKELIRERLSEREDIVEATLEDDAKADTTVGSTVVKISSPQPFESNRLAQIRQKITEAIHEDTPYERKYQEFYGTHSAGAGEVQTKLQSSVSAEESSEDHMESKASVIADVSEAIPDSVTASVKEASFSQSDPEETKKPKELLTDEITYQQTSFLSEKARIKHRVIGQVFDTYWLIEYDGKLYIIDQHAAHEKVLYERTMAQLKNKEMTTQYVSPPIIVSLSRMEQDTLEQYEGEFAELGYVISPFGGNEFAIEGVPGNLFSLDVRKLFIEVLDSCGEFKGNMASDMVLEKVASMSCKAAVKGNDHLSYQEAEELIDELLSLENPYHCPHGRPTIISMTKYEIEKKFKRIV